jgi:hypothetical protein
MPQADTMVTTEAVVMWGTAVMRVVIDLMPVVTAAQSRMLVGGKYRAR